MTPISYVPVVLALVHERSAVARLAEALRAGLPGAVTTGVSAGVGAGSGALGTGTGGGASVQLRPVSQVGALHEALAARPYALVVVEPRDANGVSTVEAVRALRDRFPEVPVVGYVVARPGMSADVLALARAGVHELVVAGIDDVAHVLRTTLARAARRSTAERVLADLLPIVPMAALPVLRYCLEHPTAAPDVPTLARAIGVSRQTLATRLRAAGLPGPRTLAIWCRLLLAAELLTGEGRTVDQVALTLDFASANALRNLLRRYADLGPGDLRRDRGAALRSAFQAVLTGRPQQPASDVTPTTTAREDRLVPS